MNKKDYNKFNNSSNGVEFILRCAKKRRAMALAAAKMLNSEMGLQSRLTALH